MESKTVDLGGAVHYADFGGPRAGPTMILVHGLGGSHVNWLGVGEALSERRRVVAIDLVGFGHTPPAGRSSRVEANRALLDRFIDTVASGHAILVGNSMGGLISILQAASRPETVEGLVLVSAPLPRPRGVSLDREVMAAFALYMIPGLGRLVMRRRKATMTPEEMSRALMRLCCVDPTRVPENVFAAHVRMNHLRREMPWVEEAFLTAARSLVRILYRRAELEAMLRAIRAPTLVLQGTGDRLVPIESARAVARMRPDWSFHELTDVGHIPQMEVPSRFVDVVDAWCRSTLRAS